MVDRGKPGMTSLRIARSVRASLGIISKSAVALSFGNRRYLSQQITPHAISSKSASRSLLFVACDSLLKGRAAFLTKLYPE